MDALQREKNLLFELIRFKDWDREQLKILLEPGIQYPWLLGQLCFHRVGGVAFWVLEQSGLAAKVNREFRNSLKTVYEMNRLKTGAYQANLARMGELFEAAEFPHAFLKGAYLCCRLYPKGLRTSNDYDLLLAPKDISACEKLLKGAGFIQCFYRYGQKPQPATRQQIIACRMNRGETVPFLRESGEPFMDYVEADLNFSLEEHAKGNLKVVPAMLEETETFLCEGRKISTLSRRDFLIQLCVHLYKEAVGFHWVKDGRDLSLYKFCDLYGLLWEEHSEEFLRSLGERILQFGFTKECYYALYTTCRIFPSLLDFPELKRFMEQRKPEDDGGLNRVIDRENGVTYRYQGDFLDWFFCGDRRSLLKEEID